MSHSNFDSFLKETVTTMRTSPLDRNEGVTSSSQVCPQGKEELDSWSILLQKFPAVLMRRSASHLLQGAKLPPIRCLVHKG